MSGNTNNNQPRFRHTTGSPGSRQVRINIPNMQPEPRWYQRILPAVYNHIIGTPGRVSGWASYFAGNIKKQANITDVASVAIPATGLALDIVSSMFSSYGTPEAKMGISFMLTLNALAIGYQGHREKINEIEDLQIKFLNSIRGELLKSNISTDAKNFAYSNAVDLTNEFKNCSYMTIVLKEGGPITLYNMKQWSRYTAIPTFSTGASWLLAMANLSCIVMNYTARASLIADGTLQGDNGFSGKVSVDTTQSGLNLPLNGTFTLPGISGGYAIDETGLRAAHLAACAANQTLNSSNIDQLLTAQPLLVSGKFDGNANITQKWPITDPHFVEFDYSTSLISSLPIGGFGDWFATFSLRQQESLGNAALKIHEYLNDEIGRASASTIFAPNIPNEVIYILEKTGKVDEAKQARDLREKIVDRNAKIENSGIMQPLIDAAIMERDAARNNFATENQLHVKAIKEKDTLQQNFADEQQKHGATKDVLQAKEKDLLSVKNIINISQDIYNALAINTSYIVLKDNLTDNSLLTNEINSSIDAFKKAASLSGEGTVSYEVLNNAAELTKTILDIAKEARITLKENIQEPDSVGPDVLSSLSAGAGMLYSNSISKSLSAKSSLKFSDNVSNETNDAITPKPFVGKKPKS